MRPPNLRKGKTKSLLESSIDSALLAVELYNKPRAPFRVETFITHMIMAWTRLFQAYFNHTMGSTYFYKEKNGRYKRIDGEKKAWELKTCIKEYNKLSEPVKLNLFFFIKLRNKIEHRTINKEEIGIIIFGECQALLYNYENELIKKFGEEYALNESLAYSLQFSRLRTTKQREASKQLLSSEYKDLVNFISKYKNNVPDDIYQSQEYSIKLIQIPKISNTNKSDLAIEFVNWNLLSADDKEKYEKITTIVKDKVVKVEGTNIGKLKPGEVLSKVNMSIQIDINHYDHKCILSIFRIRPYENFCGECDPFDTNTDYCHYNEPYKDYLYQERWVEFLIHNISNGSITKGYWRDKYKNKEVVDILNYEIENH